MNFKGLTRPNELAEALGCSPRLIRARARALETYYLFGKIMYLSDAHVADIIRSFECKSTKEKKSSTFAAPLPTDGLTEALERVTSKKRVRAQRRSQPENGNVISMDPKVS